MTRSNAKASAADEVGDPLPQVAYGCAGLLSGWVRDQGFVDQRAGLAADDPARIYAMTAVGVAGLARRCDRLLSTG